MVSKFCKMAICLMVAIGVVVGQTAQAVSGPPTEAVKGTINEVIRILEDEALKKPEKAGERRQLLEKAVEGRFSYEEMAKTSLGKPWQSLNDQQRKEFVEAFKTFLSNSYADNIARNYSGQQVQYLSERLSEQGRAEVRTKIVSPKSEIRLDYYLLNKDGEWRVYDAEVDGTRLLPNYRSQFTAIIKKSSYEDLVEKLKKKSDKIISPTP